LTKVKAKRWMPKKQVFDLVKKSIGSSQLDRLLKMLV
jgi:hypothetical protein